MCIQRFLRVLVVTSLPFIGIVTVFAQSNINPAAQSSWSENAGWMNWREANGAADGVQVGEFVLRGYIWGENIGWVNVGDGAPASPPLYSNVDDTDFGVNIAADGSLTGYAWGENVGWVNFSGGAMATPADPARIDCDGRLNGYAWSENLGWINLALAETGHYVAVESAFSPIVCDVNQDGVKNGLDVQAIVDRVLTDPDMWRSVCSADLFPAPDGDRLVTIDDIVPFVECLLAP